LAFKHIHVDHILIVYISEVIVSFKNDFHFHSRNLKLVVVEEAESIPFKECIEMNIGLGR
jgi:hypothetical protein